jgi:predicted ABC-type sugar transport system permease subunit
MAVVLNGWYVGYGWAIVVIGVVVVFVSWMLHLARRIGIQAKKINANLEDIRQATSSIGDIPRINSGLNDIAECCIAARGVLEAKFG